MRSESFRPSLQSYSLEGQAEATTIRREHVAMSLEVGKQLGEHKILGSGCAGGMGKVHWATRTNLDREIALKVLLDAMAHDPQPAGSF